MQTGTSKFTPPTPYFIPANVVSEGKSQVALRISEV